MIRNHYFKLSSWICMCLLLFSSCDKSELDEIPEAEVTSNAYLDMAKVWYENNSALAKKKTFDLEISDLTVNWSAYTLSGNSTGDTIIAIPLLSKRDTFYREISLAMNQQGIPFGIIKEYLGNPFIENTIVRMYTGRGLLLETALYDHETGTMRYILHMPDKKKSLLARAWNKIACSDCSGNMNDGFVMEEIVVTGYRNSYNYDIVWMPPNYTYNDYENYNYPEIPISPAGGYGGSAPIPSPDKLKIQPSKDPCAGRAAVNERMNNSKVRENINTVLNNTKNQLVNGKKVEYGFETVATNLSTMTFKNNPVKTGSSAQVNLHTRWNSSDGYTIGYTHSHPNNSAPSPSDLFVGNKWYSSVPAAEQSIFTDYFTSTIVTNDYIYVVTVRDAAKWVNVDLSDPAKRDAANEEYYDLSREYMRGNGLNKSTEGQLYALFNMYNDVVNIYRSPNNSVLNFQPLRYILGGVTINPC